MLAFAGIAYGQSAEIGKYTINSGGGETGNTSLVLTSAIEPIGGMATTTDYLLLAGYYANRRKTAIRLSNTYIVASSKIGTTVGFFVTDDPGIGSNPAYSLVAGAGDTNNSSFTIEGNTLSTNTELGEAEYAIRVQSSDGSRSVIATFTIQAVSVATSNVLSAGATIDNYRIFGIPTNSVPLNQVFPGFDQAMQSTSWRVVGYEGGRLKDLSTTDALAGGKGYWHIHTESTEVDLRSLEPVTVNDAFEYELSLEPGWNLVSNPFLNILNMAYTIAFNESEGVIDAGEVTPAGIYRYRGAYQVAPGLQVFEGGWLFSENAVTLRVPSPTAWTNGRTESGGILAAQSWFTSPSDWQLILEMSDGDRMTNLPGIGMHPDASDEVDRIDLRIPPEPSDKNRFIMQDRYNLARNIIAPSASGEWLYTIDAPAHQEVSLSWDREVVEKLHQGLYLHIPATNQVINMLTVDEIKIPANVALRITYGMDINPNAVEFYAHAYPNPAKGQVVFEFFMEGTGQASEVTVTIHDLSGKEVHGRQATKLSGRIEKIRIDNLALPAGPYFYQLMYGEQKSGFKKLMVR